MRLLVYGMQSSGATTFTRVLAERPDCVALVDIANNFAAPRVSTEADFVAKVVITTAYPLAVHRERFRPDKVLLLLRDPRDNYQSLKTKAYRNYSGLIDEKFALLEEVFAQRESFDAVVHYEDFVAGVPAVEAALAGLGWPIGESDRQFKRSADDLIREVWRHEPHLQESLEIVFGNSHGREVSDRWRDKPRDSAVEQRLEALCPQVLAHYRNRNAGKPA